MSVNINVVVKDNTALTISCERGIAMEISDHFSFFVPNYRYMPAYRNRTWDGRIKLYNIQTGEFPYGLYLYLKKFCDDRGYRLTVGGNDYPNPGELFPVSRSALDADIRRYDPPFPLRDYQYLAVTTALEKRRAILLSPTGSGKSFIIYNLVRWILDNEPNKILIIVPTTGLVEQMYKDFQDYNYDVENNVHKIYSGKDKTTNKRVIVSTWQSIYKFPKKWFEQFDAVFGDECHGFKSKSLSSIMNKSTEAKYRFGTTGTLDGTQTHKLVLEGLFGPVYKVTQTKKLQDQGDLAPLDITVLRLLYNEVTRQNWGKKTYREEIDFIVAHQKRNKFIRNLALSQTGNTLVLFQLVDKHGKVLYDMIRNKVEDNRKVFFVSGDTATHDREAIRHIVEQQKNAIIVASLGTFSTGINIRNLHNIIFASPSKSQIKVLQSIGRGLRVSDDGRTTSLFDIADDLHWGNRNNFTLLHSAERIKIYQAEQFKTKAVKVDIE